ncbi:hypothetical protein SEUCBS140593_009558 [Sporothrix eucalyptigena]|uniref:mRNA splicing factor RNA helicase n=1 Tax=Sporothrix eucalyptigena TaxID=1812306 RepID=A0ABP0CVS2_9PEZI
MDPSNSEEPEAPVPTLVFGRSSKKRKAYRQRGAEPTTADEPVATTPGSLSKEKEEATATEKDPEDTNGTTAADQKDDDDDKKDVDDEGITVAELIRRRKARKPRIGGVEFRDGDEPSSQSVVPSRYDDIDFDDMPMGVQFVKQTGMIGQLVNKHMEEYVDAQLAKRHQAEAHANGGPTGLGSNSGLGMSAAGLPGTSSAEAREQLAMKGKLHEIDLGAEARARNVAMTERATQRLRGTAGDDEDDSDKPRLGRDGKPLRRKRRDSDDVMRDQLVEQFLHENRMDVDVYNADREAAPSQTEGRPTDDRIAEQFRREFMEAAAQRMRRKRKPLGPPAKPKARNEEEILRGPKLGGSRNVRSVMRDKLLQKQEEERHNMPKYEQQLQEQKRRLNRRR